MEKALVTLLNFITNEFDKKETDSAEYKKQSEKCQTIFEDLKLTLTELQSKLLCNLDFEYFMRAGIWKDDGFKEGVEVGFRFAVKLIFESL